MNLNDIDKRLSIEEQLNTTTARLRSSEPMSLEVRQLLVQKQQELTRQKLELDPPAEPPGSSEAEGLAVAARSERWRAADLTFRNRRRELERELSRLDPSIDPARREALQVELRGLKAPVAAPPAPEVNS